MFCDDEYGLSRSVRTRHITEQQMRLFRFLDQMEGHSKRHGEGYNEGRYQDDIDIDPRKIVGQ